MECAKNYINCPSTVSKRMQIRFGCSLYSGLYNVGGVLYESSIIYNVSENDEAFPFLGLNNGLTNRVRVHGTEYRGGNIVILGAENHCSLTVGRIKSIIVTSSAPKLFVKKFKAVRTPLKYFAVTTALPERPAVVSLNELTDFQTVSSIGTEENFVFMLKWAPVLG